MPLLSSGYYLESENNAIFRLVGTGISFSNPTAGTVPGGATGTFFTLTGTLANGNVLNTHYFEPVSGETAPSHLQVSSSSAPEPANFYLLTLGMGVIGLATVAKHRGGKHSQSIRQN